jgi:hypothetical protein
MTTPKNISGKTLKSLTTLALALPGIQSTSAESLITRAKTDFRYTRYDEGKNRYKIDVYQGELMLPLGPKMDLVVKAGQDVMSGATVATYLPASFYGVDQDLTLIPSRSGATVYDKRGTGDINVRFFGDDYNVGVGAGISEENDYESKTLHIQHQKEFNKGNTELTWGYSFSDDAIKFVTFANTNFPARDTKRHAKNTHRFNVSVKQDLTTTSLVQGGIEFIADKGYMDDQYRVVLIYGDPKRADQTGFLPINGAPTYISHDHRPDYRGTLAGSVRFVQYITPLKASVHLGYRYVRNTWDIQSHTVNLDYHQEMGDAWEVVPSVRYYTQSAAYFYAMAFDALGNSPLAAKKPITSTSYASSDWRLAQYGSITGELKVHYKFLADQSAKFTAVVGLIDRRNSFCWGAKANPRNPTNDFKTHYMSVGLSFMF